MQIEVHPAEPGDVGNQLHAAQRLEAQMPLLVAIQVDAALEILVRGEQEAARAAGRIERPELLDDPVRGVAHGARRVSREYSERCAPTSHLPYMCVC